MLVTVTSRCGYCYIVFDMQMNEAKGDVVVDVLLIRKMRILVLVEIRSEI